MKGGLAGEARGGGSSTLSSCGGAPTVAGAVCISTDVTLCGERSPAAGQLSGLAEKLALGLAFCAELSSGPGPSVAAVIIIIVVVVIIIIVVVVIIVVVIVSCRCGTHSCAM